MTSTILLIKPYRLKSSGVLKKAGTEVIFARDSEEARQIIESGAGQLKRSLPADLPGREHLLKAGFDSIQSLAVLEEWTQVKGIGPKTAAALDDYFQPQHTE